MRQMARFLFAFVLMFSAFGVQSVLAQTNATAPKDVLPGLNQSGEDSSASTKAAIAAADAWAKKTGFGRATSTNSYMPTDMLLDMTVGKDRDPVMKIILSRIKQSIDGRYDRIKNRGLKRCVAQAILAASTAVPDPNDITSDPAFQKYLIKFGLDIITLPKAAGEKILKAGAETLADNVKDKIKDELKSKAKDYANKFIVDLQKQAPEIVVRTVTVGHCSVQFRAIWDKASGTYKYAIFGSCLCDCVRPGQKSWKPRSFMILGGGKVTPRVVGTKINFRVGLARYRMAFNCCSQDSAAIRGDSWGGRGFVVRPPREGTTLPDTKTEATKELGQPKRVDIDLKSGERIANAEERAEMAKDKAKIDALGDEQLSKYRKQFDEADTKAEVEGLNDTFGQDYEAARTNAERRTPERRVDAQKAVEKAENAQKDAKTLAEKTQADNDLKEAQADLKKARAEEKRAADIFEQYKRLQKELGEKWEKYVEVASADGVPSDSEVTELMAMLATDGSPICPDPQYALLGDPLFPPDPAISVRREPIALTTIVQEPQVCVGTHYTMYTSEGYREIEDGLIYEPILVALPQPEPVPETEEPRGVPPTETPPSTPEEPTTGTPPEEPVTGTPPEEPVTSTPPEETPPEEPGEPTTAQPPESPTTVPPEEEPPIETTETPPDLGLVKAQETVVQIALDGAPDASSLEGTVLKIFAEAPALPGPDGAAPSTAIASGDNEDIFAPSEQEEALRDPNAFSNDIISGTVAGDGTLLLSGDLPAGLLEEETTNALAVAEEDALLEEEPSEQAATTASEQPAPASQTATNAPAYQLRIPAAGPPRERAVVALKADSLEQDEGIIETVNEYLHEGGVNDAFVENSFNIGNTPVVVISYVPSTYQTIKTMLDSSTSTWFVEEDPCRNKEEIDPHHEGAGLWGQDFDNQWAIRQVGFTDRKDGRWSILPEADAKAVTVAVIDTGIDWFHPDFPSSQLWRNAGETPGNLRDDDGNGYIDDVVGWDFVRSSPKPWDRDGHGTFVAGVIAAGTDNETGIAGINPQARIMVLKALDAFGNGHASMVAEAITYAADNGARVINLSLGGRTITQIERLSIAHAREQGALVIVAAGNSGAPAAEYSPAGIPGVLTVAASDRADKRAGFSNWGPAVDIAAPGVDVLSLRARQTDLLADIRGVKYEKGAGIVGEDRAYFRASGTSFAAPIVSGVASILFALDETRSADDVKRMILNSAKDIGTPGIDNFTGYGLLDAAGAIEADPTFFVESRIAGVQAARRQNGVVVQIIGTANASGFESATMRLGIGEDPDKWFRVKVPVKQRNESGVLMELPARTFARSKSWTIRLDVADASGTVRQSRYLLTLQ